MPPLSSLTAAIRCVTFPEFMSPGVQHHHHHHNTMAPQQQQHNEEVEEEGPALCVVGVALAGARSSPVVLGSVCLEEGARPMSLEALRRHLCAEIPYLPASFNFISRDGWPIHKLQEHKVKASHVISENNCICIKKEFDGMFSSEKRCVGVVMFGGDAVGFVFTDLNVTLKQLRDVIEQQLKVTLRLDYRFVERNGWPVTPGQENVLSLEDVLLGQAVHIQQGATTAPVERFCHPMRPSSIALPSPTAAVESRISPAQESIDQEPVKRKKSLKFIRPDALSSVKLRKESEKRPRLGKSDPVRPILISYVRAEAAQYALDLKQELVRIGFNVYLDVHEIKTGSDWQDALNFAVTHCFLFVPLITPMYGKTQWTNREIKLADVLGKMIIPVNFMEHWPPPCLAIQFASTQYIPWKLQDIDHVKGEPERISDPRLWDPICIKRVSRQIAESYKEHYHKLPKRNGSAKEVLMMLNKPQMSSSTRDDYCYAPCRDDALDESKQSIVISAHPRQRYLAQDLKTMFEAAGHDVWCSVDLLEAQEALYSTEEGALTNPNTPRNLPTIQEGGGDAFFSQDEVFSSVCDKRSLSMYKEPEAYGRRPLSRLMSQFTDISQPSTLSPEKLDHLRTFQLKVDQASVVIVLLSEAYAKSTFSHQQVFYCEHRKRVVLVRCDTSPVPKWFRLLMGNDMIMKVNNPQFDCILKSRVKRALNPASSETPKDATSEAKMNYLVNFLKRNLPLQDMCVYVAGSSKLQTQRAEEICKAIGRELAKVERVSLVTGGFYGAADITAKTFCECQGDGCPVDREESAVVHILPMHDAEDLTAKARQNPDGSFEAVPYGKTVFLGDSVKERETVVARLLDTCIVVEGGPGVVHEVEEFIWNDHFVIPIMSTGGAAGGQYGVPVKIFELPPGVDVADWSVLSEKEASPEAVARAVVNIMVSLKKALSSPTATLLKAPPLLKRKSRKKLKSRRQQPPPLPRDEEEPDMHEVVTHHSFQMDPSPSAAPPKRRWWHRLIQALRQRRLSP